MRMHQTDGSENENIVQEVRVQRACKWVAECLMKEFPESMKKRQQTLYDPTLITRLEKLKREASRRFSLHRLPKNTEILHLLNRRYIIKKPIKTLSGVAPIALMTSPAPCPHGVCLQCPGGPNSSFNSPQSYTGMEPAARRGARNKYDPYLQCTSRMKQLDSMGHPIGKVELIIMGGTFSSRAPPYQRWFVGEALRAMNEYPLSQMGHPAPSGELSPMELEARARENEVAKVRCVGMTIETRPDYVIRELNHMLSLGTTKIEIGVQSTSNEVLMNIHRGHTIEDSIDANCAIRDAGLKVGFHMMPGLPGSTPEQDIKMLIELFNDERFMPDYLKIYPTLVMDGTGLMDLWKEGNYEPMDTKTAVEVIARAKRYFPKWVRVSRIQRDIPAPMIAAGVKKSNLRQLVHKRLAEMGEQCRCIRCREVGLNEYLKVNGYNMDIKIEPDIYVEKYRACGGVEHFISYEDKKNGLLIGFLRLRYPSQSAKSQSANIGEGVALIRELHVYGRLLEIGKVDGNTWQHRGIGAHLLQVAEGLAKDAGFEHLKIMSGVGVRGYYRALGYKRAGAYMEKIL